MTRLADGQALRVVVVACVVFHASSALVEVYAFARGVNAAIWGNVVARAIIIALFVHYAPPLVRGVGSPARGRES